MGNEEYNKLMEVLKKIGKTSFEVIGNNEVNKIHTNSDKSL